MMRDTSFGPLVSFFFFGCVLLILTTKFRYSQCLKEVGIMKMGPNNVSCIVWVISKFYLCKFYYIHEVYKHAGKSKRVLGTVCCRLDPRYF